MTPLKGILKNVLCSKNYYSNNFKYLKHLCSYSKDLTKQNVNHLANPDYLLQNLKNATSPAKVLELVAAHHKIMNNKHLIQTLRSLFTLQKYGNSSLSTQQILRHPDFEKLCQHLKAQAGLIELNETIEAIKVVSYVGVSSDSTIVQVLLQLIRHNINELSLHQIIFLDFLLRQFKKSPLVEALLIALPIVFEVHLPVKMERDNVIYLCEYLQFISKRPVSEKCVELIVTNLIQCIERCDNVDVKCAKSLVWSICDLEANEIFKPLLTRALHILCVNIEKMGFVDIETTLSKLISKYSLKNSYYYSDVYLDVCANYVIEMDLGFEAAVNILRKFIRISHHNKHLLDYISNICNNNPDIIINGNVTHIFNVVIGMAMTEYRPVHWDKLKDAISKTNGLKCLDKNLLWIKLAPALCILDIYIPEVMEKTLNTKYLDSLGKRSFIADYENFLLLRQNILTFKPEYKHILPEESFVQHAMRKIKPIVDYPLESSLQKALGGENYVKTAVKTQLGHHIDHLIVMRQGGYPIALTKKIEFIEDLTVSADHQIILVLALGPLHYTINTKELLSKSLLGMKTLEAQEWSVIPVSLEKWNDLEDFEKIPYLMQAIRLKTNHYVQATNVC